MKLRKCHCKNSAVEIVVNQNYGEIYCVNCGENLKVLGGGGNLGPPYHYQLLYSPKHFKIRRELIRNWNNVQRIKNERKDFLRLVQPAMEA